MLVHRKLLHHEPTSLTRSAGLLQELLNFGFEDEIAAQMAQFDRDVDRYEKASGGNFPENIRIGVALRMLPDGSLKQHLVLNSARLTTWETLKAEIDNVSCAQAAATSTPQPMGLSAYATQELEVARQGKGQRKTQGRPSEDAMPDLRQGWSLEARLTACTTRRTSSPRTRAKKARTITPPIRSSNQTKTRRA